MKNCPVSAKKVCLTAAGSKDLRYLSFTHLGCISLPSAPSPAAMTACLSSCSLSRHLYWVERASQDAAGLLYKFIIYKYDIYDTDIAGRYIATICSGDWVENPFWPKQHLKVTHKYWKYLVIATELNPDWSVTHFIVMKRWRAMKIVLKCTLNWATLEVLILVIFLDNTDIVFDRYTAGREISLRFKVQLYCPQTLNAAPAPYMLQKSINRHQMFKYENKQYKNI